MVYTHTAAVPRRCVGVRGRDHLRGVQRLAQQVVHAMLIGENNIDEWKGWVDGG